MGEEFVLDDEFYEFFEDVFFILSLDSMGEGSDWDVWMYIVGIVFVIGIDCLFVWMFFVF